LWLVYTIASLLVLLLFILCIPIYITISFNTSQEPKLTAKLKWLFGLYTSELGAKAKHIDQEPQSRQKGLGFSTIVNILRTRGLFKQFFRLTKGIFNRIKIRELDANLKVGLENPADLGLLFALMAPLNLLVRGLSPYSIVVQPDFSDETPIRGYAYSMARLQPILVAPPLFGFLLSKPGLIAIKKFLSARWKEKS
jgi:hypothetical protein